VGAVHKKSKASYGNSRLVLTSETTKREFIPGSGGRYEVHKAPGTTL